MPVLCSVEGCGQTAALKRPKTSTFMCKDCFYYAFETEIHWTIVAAKLFKKGDKVAIGASGGKDSTVLAYVMKLLNERYNYGLDLNLVAIDEGITGYRDDSLETVKKNKEDYGMPLTILSYKDLYGWSMDEIVAQIGKKNNCTFCGTFRRQALDRGAALIGANMIVTGHNADDMAETVIMNMLRGDIARLTRCTNIVTEGEGSIPRCKPLKYAHEKEIVLYAHYKKLIYFSTECTYAPEAFRGHARQFLKEIEKIRPSCFIDIIYSAESMSEVVELNLPKRRMCTRCGFVASQEVCKACTLLEGLNRGIPKMGLGKSNKAKRLMGLEVKDGSENKLKNNLTVDNSKGLEDKGACNNCNSSCGSEKDSSLDAISKKSCQKVPHCTSKKELSKQKKKEKRKFEDICCPKHSTISLDDPDEKSNPSFARLKEQRDTTTMRYSLLYQLQQLPEDASSKEFETIVNELNKLPYFDNFEKKSAPRRHHNDSKSKFYENDNGIQGPPPDHIHIKLKEPFNVVAIRDSLLKKLDELPPNASDDEYAIIMNKLYTLQSLGEDEILSDKKLETSVSASPSTQALQADERSIEKENTLSTSPTQKEKANNDVKKSISESDKKSETKSYCCQVTCDKLDAMDDLSDFDEPMGFDFAKLRSFMGLSAQDMIELGENGTLPEEKSEICFFLIHDNNEDHEIHYTGKSKLFKEAIKRMNEQSGIKQPHLTRNEEMNSEVESDIVPKLSSVLLSNSSEPSQNLETCDEQPNVVKANPKRKGPSVLLPEMMYKTKNDIEF